MKNHCCDWTAFGFDFALHRVSVEIEWGSFGRDKAEAGNVLKSLTTDRFPRLSECYSHVRVFGILNNDVYNNSYYLIKLMKTDLILPGIAGLELGIGMTKGGRG